MKYKQLTSEQRYTISVLLKNKASKSFIASTIGVSVSTVSREIKRNANSKGVYDYRLASLRTLRRKRGNPGNRSISPHVRCRVFSLIRAEQWSPEEVAGWLKRNEQIQVSKSTIYNWIADISPHCKDNIRHHLRHGGRRRKKPRYRHPAIADRVSIDIRPSAGYGQTFGDWEMDTIVGRHGKGAIVTLVDRKSSFLAMKKIDTGKQAKPMAKAVIELLKSTRLPVRSITTDNGVELAAHKAIAQQLNTTVYFTHPYSAWEKGAVENINGLIRQYIPKKSDFNEITNTMIEHITQKLNNRPRKKNNFRTPYNVVKEIFA